MYYFEFFDDGFHISYELYVCQLSQWDKTNSDKKKKKKKMFNSASVLNIFEVLYYTHIKQFLKITDSNL